MAPLTFYEFEKKERIPQKEPIIKDFIKEKYYDPFREIKCFLKKIIPKYGLSDVIMEPDELCSNNNSFIVKVPNSLDSMEMLTIWDDLVDETSVFSKENKIESTFEKSFILLRR